MKRQTIILALGFLLLLGCEPPQDNAPFNWHFKKTSDNQFQYTAQGNVDSPSNTEAGEQIRMDFLRNYMKQNGLCPDGYDILSRTPAPLQQGRPDLSKQQYRMITYVVQCHR